MPSRLFHPLHQYQILLKHKFTEYLQYLPHTVKYPYPSTLFLCQTRITSKTITLSRMTSRPTTIFSEDLPGFWVNIKPLGRAYIENWECCAVSLSLLLLHLSQAPPEHTHQPIPPSLTHSQCSHKT